MGTNIKLTDFHKGENAYILKRNLGYNKPSEIIEATVTQVGKKYVHVKVMQCTYKYEYSKHHRGLLEVQSYGDKTILFATRKKAEEEIERADIIRFINRNLELLNKCTLDELRDIHMTLQNTQYH